MDGGPDIAHVNALNNDTHGVDIHQLDGKPRAEDVPGVAPPLHESGEVQHETGQQEQQYTATPPGRVGTAQVNFESRIPHQANAGEGNMDVDNESLHQTSAETANGDTGTAGTADATGRTGEKGNSEIIFDWITADKNKDKKKREETEAEWRRTDATQRKVREQLRRDNAVTLVVEGALSEEEVKIVKNYLEYSTGISQEKLTRHWAEDTRRTFSTDTTWERQENGETTRHRAAKLAIPEGKLAIIQELLSNESVNSQQVQQDLRGYFKIVLRPTGATQEDSRRIEAGLCVDLTGRTDCNRVGILTNTKHMEMALGGNAREQGATMTLLIATEIAQKLECGVSQVAVDVKKRGEGKDPRQFQVFVAPEQCGDGTASDMEQAILELCMDKPDRLEQGVKDATGGRFRPSVTRKPGMALTTSEARRKAEEEKQAMDTERTVDNQSEAIGNLFEVKQDMDRDDLILEITKLWLRHEAGINIAEAAQEETVECQPRGSQEEVMAEVQSLRERSYLRKEAPSIIKAVDVFVNRNGCNMAKVECVSTRVARTVIKLSQKYHEVWCEDYERPAAGAKMQRDKVRRRRINAMDKRERARAKYGFETPEKRNTDTRAPTTGGYNPYGNRPSTAGGKGGKGEGKGGRGRGTAAEQPGTRVYQQTAQGHAQKGQTQEEFWGAYSKKVTDEIRTEMDAQAKRLQETMAAKQQQERDRMAAYAKEAKVAADKAQSLPTAVEELRKMVKQQSKQHEEEIAALRAELHQERQDRQRDRQEDSKKFQDLMNANMEGFQEVVTEWLQDTKAQSGKMQDEVRKQLAAHAQDTTEQIKTMGDQMAAMMQAMEATMHKLAGHHRGQDHQVEQDETQPPDATTGRVRQRSSTTEALTDRSAQRQRSLPDEVDSDMKRDDPMQDI